MVCLRFVCAPEFEQFDYALLHKRGDCKNGNCKNVNAKNRLKFCR
jgi:hypothetical protein